MFPLLSFINLYCSRCKRIISCTAIKWWWWAGLSASTSSGINSLRQRKGEWKTNISQLLCISWAGESSFPSPAAEWENHSGHSYSLPCSAMPVFPKWSEKLEDYNPYDSECDSVGRHWQVLTMFPHFDCLCTWIYLLLCRWSLSTIISQSFITMM